MQGTLRESKPTVVVRFGVYGQPLGKEHSGTLHLFEHGYDKTFSFWWGVAEVACNQADIQREQAKAMGQFIVSVKLSDGRTGIARLTNLHADYTAPGSVISIALAGEQDLKGAP